MYCSPTPQKPPSKLLSDWKGDYSRFSVRVNYKGKEDGYKKEGKSASRRVFDWMKAADPSAQIVPFKASQHALGTVFSNTKQFKNFSDSERNQLFADMRFSKFGFGKFTATIYFDVFICHKITREALVQSFRESTQGERISIFIRHIQMAEKTKEVGWLLYSMAELDQDLLAAALAQAANTEVELTWKVINPLHKFDWLDEEKANKALHIRIPDDPRFQDTVETLSVLLSSRSTTWPRQIRLRLVLTGNERYLTSARRETRLKLNLRQARFAPHVHIARIWSIAPFGLEKKIVAWGDASVRDLIMKATVPADLRGELPADTKVFLFAERQPRYDDQCYYNAGFSPHCATPAHSIIASMVAYLKYLVTPWGPQALEALHMVMEQVHLDRHFHDTWDPIKGESETKQDRENQALAEGDVDLILGDIKKLEITNLKTTKPQPQTPPPPPAVFGQTDIDSLPTVKDNTPTLPSIEEDTAHTGKKKKRKEKSKTKTSKNKPDTNSTTNQTTSFHQITQHSASTPTSSNKNKKPRVSTSPGTSQSTAVAPGL